MCEEKHYHTKRLFVVRDLPGYQVLIKIFVVFVCILFIVVNISCTWPFWVAGASLIFYHSSFPVHRPVPTINEVTQNLGPLNGNYIHWIKPDQKLRWRFTGRCWQLYAPTQTKKTRFSPGVSSIYEKHSFQELVPQTAALYVSMQLKCNSTQLQHLKWFHGLQFSSWSLFLSWELRDQLASQQTDECNKMQFFFLPQ